MLNVIVILQMVTYSTSALIIISALLYSFYIAFAEHKEPIVAFYDVRSILGESVALSLSFILCVQILKLFTVREYKELVIVSTLVILKLLVTYTVSNEIIGTSSDTIKRIKGEEAVKKIINLRNK
jgi:uncharacterized membrane protein